MARCSICGEDIPRRLSRFSVNPHFKSLHQDFVVWRRHWLRSFFLIDISMVVALILTYYLWFRYENAYPAGIATLVFIVFVYSMMGIWLRKIRQFNRTWKEEHRDPSPQSGTGATPS